MYIHIRYKVCVPFNPFKDYLLYRKLGKLVHHILFIICNKYTTFNKIYIHIPKIPIKITVQNKSHLGKQHINNLTMLT